MTERPEYRADLPPAGSRYFQCSPLRALLNTKSCGERWTVAPPGSSCHGCPLGRMHAEDHAPSKRAGRRPVDNEVRACARCGRTDLRIIKSGCVCVSCYNRTEEWRRGRNAKGKPPERFQPLRNFEVVLQHNDGRIERRLLQALHEAEAIVRATHALPEGARFASERRLTAWNRTTCQFEVVCPSCGGAGLVLERVRGGALERHHWCCAGTDPVGQGWQVAEARQPIFAMTPDALAATLNGDPELANDAPCEWTPTAHPCAACGGGQVEAQLLAPNGRWKTRCRACGVSSEQV